MLKLGGQGGGNGRGRVNVNLFAVSRVLFRLMEVRSNMPKVQ